MTKTKWIELFYFENVCVSVGSVEDNIEMLHTYRLFSINTNVKSHIFPGLTDAKKEYLSSLNFNSCTNNLPRHGRKLHHYGF